MRKGRDDLLYLRRANEARQKYDARAADTKAAFAIRDMTGSGPHISRMGEDRVDYVHDLTAIRWGALLAAYEAAGIAIDDGQRASDPSRYKNQESREPTGGETGSKSIRGGYGQGA